jgi:uncharacterized protein
MIIDIRTIPAGHSVLSQKCGLDAFKVDLPALVHEVACQAEIDRNGSMLYVHLRFEGTFDLECSRCLTHFPWTVAGEIRTIVRERQGATADDDVADFFYDSQKLSVDMGPALYEEIMTSIPLKPLCTPECSGIAIRTTGPEKGAAIDPRWEALKKLKSK